MPNKAVGMPNGAPKMPNGGAPGVLPGTEAGAAGVQQGVPLGEFALLDVDRRRRTGVPEVVFGEGKTSEQIFALLAELRARDPEAPALATRCPAGVLDGAATRFPGDAVHADQVAGTAECVVVVAGMDGALPSVVAGLVSAPVIGVPTSVGYGVAAGGLAAAASMLSSCSPGLVVVNIDNGFGAAAHAAKIIRAVHR